ncbi:glycoside hydrolase family protein [Paracoccus sp. 22332]|uniref:glycoside hydrolase family protein n=1 Tax=Paracoccus sp. 22332 TaxID=3453913 RepID=UPI003F87C06A
MQTSDKGVAFLVAHEGIVPAPYRDSVGVWTFGIGHTAAAGPPIPATMPRGMPADLDTVLREVFAVFRRDLARYEADVLNALGRTPTAQHEFDAAVSFHFNTGAIGRAAWVNLWKRGQKADAAASMLANWRKPAEIIGRRTAERDLFLTGDYGKAKATVWQVSSTGKVIWKPAKRLFQSDILALMGREDAETPLHRLQRALAAIGLYTGRIDGIDGPRTQAALSAFNRARDEIAALNLET